MKYTRSSTERGKSGTSWWRNRSSLALAVFLVVAGYFLWTEHRAHVIEFLPWLLILGCIGMHLFMHGGHAHGADAKQHDKEQPGDER